MAALEELGPLTRAEVCREVGLDRECVSPVLTRMHRAGKVHVASYVYDDEKARLYPRAVYAAGSGKDAKKPVSNPKEVRRKSDRVTQARIKTSSVFNLGLTRAQLRQISRVEVGGASGQDQ